MEDSQIQRAPYPEHPNRCQGITRKGQCDKLSVKNGTFCLLHGGNKQLEAQEAASLKNYRIGIWQSKINRFSESSQIKDLREEIGILRMILEERLNICKTETDLMLHSHVISDMVMKIEKVVVSCNKLEASLGQHMDKTALMSFAQQVINIISINITDRDQIDVIANSIVNTLIEGDNHENT